MAAHRYWRINVTGNLSTAHCDIREIELRTSIGGADVTGSGTASASAEASGYEASKAFDDNASTLWYFSKTTYALPQWIKYDFGAGNDKDIVEFALTAASSSEMVTDFALQYSDDNSAWTTLYEIAGEYVWGSTEQKVYSANNTITSNGERAGWRINTSAVNSGPYVGIAEIQMRLTAGGADQCTGGKAFASSIADVSHIPPYAFDDNGSTKWANDGTLPDWIGYRFAAAKTIAELAITARNDVFSYQAPTAFTLEYWNGSTWLTALTVSGSTGWAAGETRTWTVPPLSSGDRARAVFCM